MSEKDWGVAIARGIGWTIMYISLYKLGGIWICGTVFGAIMGSPNWWWVHK